MLRDSYSRVEKLKAIELAESVGAQKATNLLKPNASKTNQESFRKLIYSCMQRKARLEEAKATSDVKKRKLRPLRLKLF